MFWRMIESELPTSPSWLLKLERHDLDVKCSNGEYVPPPPNVVELNVAQSGSKCDISFTLCGTAIVHKSVVRKLIKDSSGVAFRLIQSE
jgi:hypothetical protein